MWKCRTDRGPVVGDRYQVRGRSDGDGLLLSAYKDRADEQDEHQKPDRARQDPLAPRRLPSPRLQRAGVEQRLGVELPLQRPQLVAQLLGALEEEADRLEGYVDTFF